MHSKQNREQTEKYGTFDKMKRQMKKWGFVTQGEEQANTV